LPAKNQTSVNFSVFRKQNYIHISHELKNSEENECVYSIENCLFDLDTYIHSVFSLCLSLDHTACLCVDFPSCTVEDFPFAADILSDVSPGNA
jgi:hypothetical protein